MVATGVLDGANSATFVEGMEVATVDFGSETKGEIFHGKWPLRVVYCIYLLKLYIKQKLQRQFF